jgi:hypothetical protein
VVRFGFIATEEIWHGQEILMANREYSSLPDEDSMESLAPPTAVSQEGYMQEEPEPEGASESDTVVEDPTTFSSHQYAALTDMGG